MRFRHRGGRLLILLTMIVSLIVPSANGYATTQRQKALNAYKKMLTQSTISLARKGERIFHLYNNWDGGNPIKAYKPSKASKVQFAIAYIDNDSVPELILKYRESGESTPGIFAVYTYKNGNVRKVYSHTSNDAVIGYYPKTGIYKIRINGEYRTDAYYKLKGTKAASTLRYTYDTRKCENANGKSISRASFIRTLNSLRKRKKLTGIKYYTNTSANRKKYLR